MSMGLRMTFSDDGTFMSLNLKLKQLADPDLRDLLDIVGSEVEAQTRTRIQDEKKTPAGVDWKDWSEGYAASKHGPPSHQPHPGQLRQAGGHSLLQLTGSMLDSIQYVVSGGDEVLIGSNMVYARAVDSDRQYLGLSSQNAEDVEQVVVDFFEELLK